MSVVLNAFTGVERVLKMPVYSVAADGSFALTLDFTRLHRLRPGYGYSNVEEATKNEKIPDAACIWKLDIVNDTVTPVLKYSDFATFEPRKEMAGAEHKVNHIMISPNGKRFMVLHRWFNGDRKYSRLVTVNVDGTEMYNLSDDDMVSHCYWKDDQTIIAFENKKKAAAPAAPAAPAPAAPAPVALTTAAPAGTDDAEMERLAVMTAIIEHRRRTASSDSLVVRPIKRSAGNRWKRS